MMHDARSHCWSPVPRAGRLSERTRRACVRFPDRLKAVLQQIAAALVLFSLAIAVVAHAEDKPRVPWWERCKQPLSPQVERALADVAAKMTPLRRKDIAEHMDEVMESLFQTTGLTDEAKQKAIKDAAAAALEETMKPFLNAVTETNRVRLTATGAIPTVASMSNWPIEQAALARMVRGCKLPDQQPVWTAALKANLSADQLAKWDKLVTEKRKARDEAITSLLKQWQDTYRDMGTQLMEMRIKAMASELKLDDNRMRKLRDAAADVVDRICKEEVSRATESLRFEIDKRFQESQARSRGTFNGYPIEMNPAHDAEWLQAVARIVKPDELAKWERHLAEEKAKFDKEIPNLLKGSIDQLAVQWKAGLDMVTSNLIITLGLSEERAKALEPAAKAAMERAEKTYVRLAKEQLDKVDNAYREQILKQGRFYIPLEDSDLPQNDPSFKEALQQLLSPDEKKRLAAAQDERNARRVRSLGQIMIAEMDKRVAFTGSQRERLQPIAGRLLKNVEELFPANRINYGYNFGLEKFFAAGLSATDAELKAILDSVQLERWREVCKASTTANDQRRGITAGVVTTAAAKEPQRKPEPEDVEMQISDYLQKKTVAERKRLLELMVVQAEDATRVAALPADVSANLQTAARGAVERALATWKSNTERNLRSNIQGVTPGNVKQRLASMEGYYYERNDNSTAGTQSVWKKTVAAKLNDAQRAAWQKEVDARKDYQWRAVASAVLAEFDRRIVLTTEQWNKLEPVLAQIVKDYSQDIENYFSNTTPWYLQTYSTLLPVAGVPEKELKTILSKSQWDRWSGEDLANAMNYWENIEQNHKSRVKQVK